MTLKPIQELRCTGEIDGLDLEQFGEEGIRKMEEARARLARAQVGMVSGYESRTQREISVCFRQKAVDQVARAVASRTTRMVNW